MIRTMVARRYAKALFEVALERDVLESTQEGLDRFAAVIKDVPLLIGCLDNVEIGIDQRYAVVDGVVDVLGVSELVRDFFKLLVSAGRANSMRDVAQIHRELMASALAFTQATAIVADANVAEKTRKHIEEMLEKKLGRPARCTVEVDPNLIGGLILRMGDETYDASVAGRIEQLKDDLLRL